MPLFILINCGIIILGSVFLSGAWFPVTDGGGFISVHVYDPSPLQPIMSIILDPVLAYVHAGVAAGTVEATTKATLAFFPREAIVKAKDVIYDQCSAVTGTKQKRRDGDLRTATEADLQDIITALRKVDTCSDPPTFAVPSFCLHSLPRSKPEELLSLSIADRMASLEEQHNHMREIIDGLVLNKLDHSFRLRRLEEGCHHKDKETDVQPQAKNGSDGIQQQTQGQQRQSGQQQRSQPQRQWQHGEQRKPTEDAASNTYASIVAAISAAAKAADVGEEPFQPVRPRKRTYKKPRVIGKGDQGAGLKGAPEPSRHLFIHRVDKSSTCNDVVTYVTKKLKVTPRDIECKSREEAAFKSFKLTVAVSDYKTLFDEQLWPEGVCVRPWRENQRRKPSESEEDSRKDQTD